MQRKRGWTVSGAQRRLASAPAMDALQRAAHPEVWERFSQSASSASAETLGVAAVVRFRRAVLGIFGFVRHPLLAGARAVSRKQGSQKLETAASRSS